MYKFTHTFLFVFIVCLSSFSIQPVNDHIPAEKIKSDFFDNLYRIDQDLYRSEQPTKEGMIELQNLGIKTVLNVRNRRNDKREAKGTNLILERYKINTWRMDYNDVVEVLKIIKKAEKPVVLHCLHGADRTGIIVAAYRMACNGWSKEEAINEFLMPQFGYHQKWFPKILELLKTFGAQQLKHDLKQ